MLTPLINTSDIQAFEAMSSNIDFDKKLRPHVIDAQEFDVRPLLGEQLWIELISDVSAFSDLWLPFEYSYKGKNYQHPGLKSVVVMFTVARYRGDANNHETAFGSVQKTNPFSEPISEKTIARRMASARSGAEVYWTRVRDYLNRHASDYPNWNCARKSRLTGNGLRFKKASRF